MNKIGTTESAIIRLRTHPVVANKNPAARKTFASAIIISRKLTAICKLCDAALRCGLGRAANSETPTHNSVNTATATPNDLRCLTAKLQDALAKSSPKAGTAGKMYPGNFDC